MARISVVAFAMVALADAAWAQRPDARVAQSMNPDEPARSLLERPARLNIEHLPLEAALNALTRTSGVPLAFSPARMPRGARVSCACADVDTRSALDQLLAETSLEYVELSGQIVLFPEGDSQSERGDLLIGLRNTGRLARSMMDGKRGVARGDHADANGDHMRVVRQDTVAAGVVTDSETGRGVNGVDVSLEDTRWRATTDAGGRYRLADVTPGSYTLVAGRIGYVTARRAVTVTAGQEATVDVALQPAATQLGEVVVTAQKRAESLQDTPAAVSAISTEDMQARGLTQYADYLNSVPGIYFEDAGPGVSQIRIRGIVASEGLGPATVATYFGETITSVLTNLGGKPNMRLVDIERVELLRGPQGTLFGANSLSGVVRIVPAEPDLQDFEVNLGTRGFTTAHSSDASYHVEGTINIPLIQDRLALRVVAYKDDIAGFIDNVVPARDPIDHSFVADIFTEQPIGTTPAGTLVLPGTAAFTREDINSEDTWGVRAALAWQATDRLRFDLTQATQIVELDSEPHVTAGAGDYVQRRPLDVFAPGLYLERLDISSLVVGYEGNAVSLTSASSYTKMRSDRHSEISFLAEEVFTPIFGPGLPLPWENRADSKGEVFTQELRLQSKGDAPLQWLAGLFYLDQQADLDQIVSDHSCPTCLATFLFDQDFVFDILDPRYLNQEQRSLFGEVSYRFTPQWTVGVGARYLEEDLEAPNPALEGLFVGGFAPAMEPRRGSSHEFNPSAYVRYEPTEDATLYVQAARGFRSGVTNPALAYTGVCEDEAAAIGLGPLVPPDRLWSYELGTKLRFNEGRVAVNAAVYKQDWKGVQLDAVLGGDCGLDGIVSGGNVGGEGAELEVAAQLSDAWRANLSAAYTHNEFDSVKPRLGFEVGERVPGAAENNASVGLQYEFMLAPEWSGFVRADYSYVGSARYKFGQTDPLIVNQDAYNSTSARLGVQRDDVAVELFGRNLTDERAVVASNNLNNGGAVNLMRPREIGVEVRYSLR